MSDAKQSDETWLYLGVNHHGDWILTRRGEENELTRYTETKLAILTAELRSYGTDYKPNLDGYKIVSFGLIINSRFADYRRAIMHWLIYTISPGSICLTSNVVPDEKAYSGKTPEYNPNHYDRVEERFADIWNDILPIENPIPRVIVDLIPGPKYIKIARRIISDSKKPPKSSGEMAKAVEKANSNGATQAVIDANKTAAEINAKRDDQSREMNDPVVPPQAVNIDSIVPQIRYQLQQFGNEGTNAKQGLVSGMHKIITEISEEWGVRP